MDAFRSYLKRNRITLARAAKALGRSESALKKWGTDRPYPPEALPGIEIFTGGEVTGRILRPDLYMTTTGREAA